MAMTLRDLVYTKHFPTEITQELLAIADSPDWVERLLDLLHEHVSEDGDDTIPGNCLMCDYRDRCDTYGELDGLRKLKDGIVDILCQRELDRGHQASSRTELEKMTAGVFVKAAEEILREEPEEPEIPKGKCIVGGILCPCDEVDE